MNAPARKPNPMTIVTWLYDDISGGLKPVPLAIGLGLMYYWIGGLPNQGQDVMTLAQGYLLGGVGNYAYDYVQEGRSGPSY
jgi:hypothetical protein